MKSYNSSTASSQRALVKLAVQPSGINYCLSLPSRHFVICNATKKKSSKKASVPKPKSEKLKRTIERLDMLLATEEVKPPVEEIKPDKDSVQIEDDRNTASNGGRLHRLIEKAKSMAGLKGDFFTSKDSAIEKEQDYQYLLNGFIRLSSTQSPFSREDVRLARESVFGAQNFWVISAECVESRNISRALLLRGNLRAPRQQVFQEARKRVQEVFKGKYVLMMIPDPGSPSTSLLDFVMPPPSPPSTPLPPTDDTGSGPDSPSPSASDSPSDFKAKDSSTSSSSPSSSSSSSSSSPSSSSSSSSSPSSPSSPSSSASESSPSAPAPLSSADNEVQESRSVDEANPENTASATNASHTRTIPPFLQPGATRVAFQLVPSTIIRRRLGRRGGDFSARLISFLLKTCLTYSCVQAGVSAAMPQLPDAFLDQLSSLSLQYGVGNGGKAAAATLATLATATNVLQPLRKMLSSSAAIVTTASSFAVGAVKTVAESSAVKEATHGAASTAAAAAASKAAAAAADVMNSAISSGAVLNDAVSSAVGGLSSAVNTAVENMGGGGSSAAVLSSALGRGLSHASNAEMTPTDSYVSGVLAAASEFLTDWAAYGPFLRVAAPVTLGLLGTAVVQEAAQRVACRHKGVGLGPQMVLPDSMLGILAAVTPFDQVLNDRKELWDASIAGPTAGLIFSAALLALGLLQQAATPMPISQLVAAPSALIQGSLFLDMIVYVVSITGGVANTAVNAAAAAAAAAADNQGFAPSAAVAAATAVSSSGALAAAAGGGSLFNDTMLVSPLALAGWCGLMSSAVQLLPVGRLAGGRLVKAAFGYNFLVLCSITTSVGLCTGTVGLKDRALLLGLLIAAMGGQEDLVADTVEDVGPVRKAATVAAVAAAAFLLTPMPAEVARALGLGGAVTQW